MSLLHGIHLKDKDAGFREVRPAGIRTRTTVDVAELTLCKAAINTF